MERKVDGNNNDENTIKRGFQHKQSNLVDNKKKKPHAYNHNLSYNIQEPTDNLKEKTYKEDKYENTGSENNNESSTNLPYVPKKSTLKNNQKSRTIHVEISTNTEVVVVNRKPTDHSPTNQIQQNDEIKTDEELEVFEDHFIVINRHSYMNKLKYALFLAEVSIIHIID